VTLSVAHVNHSPTVTAGGTVNTLEDTAVTISGVFASDPDGDPLSVYIGEPPTFGVFVQTNGVNITSYPALITDTQLDFVYVPNPNANGMDHFYVTVSDGYVRVNSTVAMINVTAVDDPPIAYSSTTTMNEDAGTTTITVSYFDIDSQTSEMSLTVLSLPSSSVGTLQWPNGSVVAVGDQAPYPLQVVFVNTPYTFGNTSFLFYVKDSTSYSNVATVYVNVSHVNHPPSAYWTGNAVANENGVLVINEIQVSDPDAGDVLSVFVTTGPTNGTLTQYNGNPCNVPCLVTDPQNRMLFTPTTYEYGNPYVSITFVGSDGQINSTVMSGNITINHVDQPPVALPVQVSAHENDPTVQITFNYTDIDTPAANMSVIVVSLPASSLGVLQAVGGATIAVGDRISYPLQAVFIPATYQYGNTSFSFRVADYTSSSANIETVSINISHVNHAPTAYWAGTAQADENSVLTISQIQVSDPDVGDVLSVYVTQIPVNGTLQQFDGTACVAPCLVTDSQYRMKFEPLTYGYGNPYATFKFLASDGSLNINFVNQAPVALASTVQILENDPDTPFNITYFDVDSTLTVMTATILSLPSSVGILKTTGGQTISVGDVIAAPLTVLFSPSLYSYGVTSFSFQVKDATLYSNTSQLITFNVTHVNHPPVAYWSGTATADEDTTMIITELQASDPDVGDVISMFVTVGPSNGTLMQYNGSVCTSYPCLVGDSQYRMKFLPDLNANGIPFTYISFQAFDGALYSNVTTGTLSINPVDDPPIAEPTTVTLNENSNSTFTLNYTDIDSPPQDIYGTILSLPSPSVGILTNASGAPVAVGDTIPSLQLVFMPASYVSGNASFSFQVHDATSYSVNSSTVSLLVLHVNNPPTAANVSVVASREVPLSIVISGFDHDDGDTFTFNLVAIDANGGTYLANGTALTSSSTTIATGIPNTASHTFSTTVNYTAPINASGTNFSYIIFSITDQSGASTGPVEVSVGITPNSVPIATADSINVTQDSISDPIFINGTDADPADANTLIAVITATPTKGTLFVNDTTNVTSVPFSLPAGSSVTYYTEVRGGDSFEFHVVDNLGAQSGSVVVPISITPVNHPPSAQFSGPVTTLENQNITITQISTSDPDGDVVSVWINSLPDLGYLCQYDGTPITTVPTLVNQSQSWIIYVPPHGQFGVTNFTFYADDGQGEPNSQTATFTAVLGITRVDGAPIAVNSTITVDEGASYLNVTLTVIDSDTPLSNLSVYLTSLPDPAIGTLYDLNGATIQPFVSTSLSMRFVLVQFAYGNTSFGFLGFDGELNSADVATLQITINHINQVCLLFSHI
jgi:hypothetical protein